MNEVLQQSSQTCFPALLTSHLLNVNICEDLPPPVALVSEEYKACLISYCTITKAWFVYVCQKEILCVCVCITLCYPSWLV